MNKKTCKICKKEKPIPRDVYMNFFYGSFPPEEEKC